mmetsp:Transcript_24644/g.66405  ORF Transcript_24644/g.66405 Transcript_24644/m.66405 type:complete len:201 (+) Transcript_24644:1052-1654(+)
MSSAVTGAPALLRPMTMLPSLSLISPSDVVRASTAIISDATAISKPVSRVAGVTPLSCSLGPSPTLIRRSIRSHVSSTRFHVMVLTSMSRRANADTSASVSSSGSVLAIPSLASRLSITGLNLRVPSFAGGHNRLNKAASLCWLSWKIRVSIAAARRLFAATMAWMSPVRCRLNSSIGTTCAYPPPAAPPFVPKVGPCDG